jgi:hypothetical protein
MKRTQVLASGLTVRQDIGDAVRAIFFQTEFEDWLYATDGGTAFIVRYQGRMYGLTCGHVLKSFNPGQLFITCEKFGQKGTPPAHVEGLFHPSSPRDGAVGTDVTDICVLEFSEEIPSNFFKGGEYIVDQNTWTMSKKGNRLRVQGVLKEKSSIIPPDITMGFCNLEFQDAGPYSPDPFLRQAVAEFANPDFTSITGTSGSPVFDETENALSGMVVRGSMNGKKCSILYFDISDVVRVLDAARNNLPNIYYLKLPQ